MELFHGRPDDCSGRLARELRVYDYLDKLGIEYWRTDHFDMPAMTMEDCNKIDAVLGVLICKNLFLCNRQKTDFYLLLMPGDKPFRTKELSKKLDIQPGAVSVMGLMNDRDKRVRLVVDGDVLRQEYFGCHPCVNTSSIRLLTRDVVEKFIPSTGHEMTFVELTGED